MLPLSLLPLPSSTRELFQGVSGGTDRVFSFLDFWRMFPNSATSVCIDSKAATYLDLNTVFVKRQRKKKANPLLLEVSRSWSSHCGSVVMNLIHEDVDSIPGLPQ